MDDFIRGETPEEETGAPVDGRENSVSESEASEEEKGAPVIEHEEPLIEPEMPVLVFEEPVIEGDAPPAEMVPEEIQALTIEAEARRPNFIHRVGAGVAGRLRRAKQAITPGRRAWRGAALGLWAAAAVFVAGMAYDLLFVPSPDPVALLMILSILVLAAITGLLLLLLVTLLKRLPSVYTWALFGISFVVIVSMILSGAGGIAVAAVAGAVIVPFSLAGAGFWVLARGGLHDTTRFRASIALVGLLLGGAALAAGVYWLAYPGEPATPPPNASEVSSGMAAAPVTLPNPSQPGNYTVLEMTYGSGQDLRREEYGKGASLITGPVDGAPFWDLWSGPAGWARTRYWGFEASSMPLNGRVWYPQGEGPFPLVLMVHGNHLMYDYSDPGYAYLGKLLASRGFIAVSVDENFFNGSPTDLLAGPDGFTSSENDGRAWLLLEHLRAWHTWNEDSGNPFYQKVDVDNIALLGHSRGGEAVAVASVFNRLPYYPDDASVAFDYNYNIRSVVAIAPVDGQYQPAGLGAVPEDVSYFTLHGSYDGDMRSFHGSRVYERVKFSGSDYHFKAYLYIYGANHGQFNTSWGRSDLGNPWARFLNLKSIMPAEQQEQIAKVFISAFLEATLNGKSGYIPLFRDYRAASGWLPGVVYVQQFADSDERLVADFEEDVNLATTGLEGGGLSGHGLTVWREQVVEIKWGSKDTSAVYLGWDAAAGISEDPASYTISLPQRALALDQDSALFFSLADTAENPNPKGLKTEEGAVEESGQARQPIDLTIELVDARGAVAGLPLSSYAYLQPSIEAQVMKAAFMNSTPVAEVVFQRFEFPLSAFVEANEKFDPSRLVSVRLVFDRAPSGVIALDGVGFRP